MKNVSYKPVQAAVKLNQFGHHETPAKRQKEAEERESHNQKFYNYLFQTKKQSDLLAANEELALDFLERLNSDNRVQSCQNFTLQRLNAIKQHISQKNPEEILEKHSRLQTEKLTRLSNQLQEKLENSSKQLAKRLDQQSYHISLHKENLWK